MIKIQLHNVSQRQRRPEFNSFLNIMVLYKQANLLKPTQVYCVHRRYFIKDCDLLKILYK